MVITRDDPAVIVIDQTFVENREFFIHTCI